MFAGSSTPAKLSAAHYRQEIESAFAGFDLSRYDRTPKIRSKAESAINAARAWVEAAIEGRGRGLVLWASEKREIEGDGKKKAYSETSPEGLPLNSYGNGKSRLAKCAGNALFSIQYLDQYGISVRPFNDGVYIKTKILKDEIIRAYHDKEGREYSRYMAKFWRAGFIILDDLGTEAVKDDSLLWWQGELYSIIDLACERAIPLLITSNFAPDYVGELVGGKVWDRVSAMTNGKQGFINMSIIPSQRRNNYAESWKE